MGKAPVLTEYFNKCKENQDKYGKNTLVMFQVGSFYEVYGKFNDDSSTTYINEFSEICGMKISTKANCFMCGGPLYNGQLYIDTMNNEGFTVVIYDQDSQSPGTTRSLKGVYSPGTVIKDDTNNSIVSIYVKQIQQNSFYRTPRIIFGISIINIHTGHTYVCEYNEEYRYSPITFDKVEQLISSNNPSELLLFSDGFKLDTKTFIQFINGEKIMRVKRCELTRDNTILKQTYQEEIINKYHSPCDINIFMETTMFSREMSSACIAHCMLLEYLDDHNPLLVKKLDTPNLYNGNGNEDILLANHSLQQLNIISDGRSSGKLSSLVDWVDCCKTKMGSRFIQYSLVHPTSSVQTLEKNYDIMNWLIKHDTDNFMDVVSTTFKNVDIEKIRRKMILKSGTIKDLFQLIESICIIQECLKGFNKDTEDQIETFCSLDRKKLASVVDVFYMKLTNVIDVNSLDDEIFCRGVYPSLDEKVRNYKESNDKLNAIAELISSIIPEKSKKTSLCSVVKTEKNGMYLKITSRRAGLLEQAMKKHKTKKFAYNYVSSYDGVEKQMFVSLTDMKFSKATGNDKRIDSVDIQTIVNNEITLKEKIENERKNKLEEFIQTILLNEEEFNTIISYIKNVDVLYAKVRLLVKYNYSVPSIDNNRDESYCSFKALRHPLIEQINQNERYVANDVDIGRRLLFGTNAVGKTSLIRAIGMSVIMAQSGFCVPCKDMTYKPYCKLFTRIIGNDNIFKGLSTFQVEMSEMMQIVKYSDERSLVLGDELCSGTEIESAIAIFSTGLIHLCSKSASFIFATHFHDVLKVPEIEGLVENGSFNLNHLYVHYDASIDALVYDRELREGVGDKQYGIEVCKSIGFPNEFIQQAINIRKSIATETQQISERKVSKYNARKVKGNCEMCGEAFEEVHHLEYQEFADERGILPDGYTHKNHKANLASICSKCHDNIHKKKKIMKRTKTTKGFTFTEVLNKYN